MPKGLQSNEICYCTYIHVCITKCKASQRLFANKCTQYTLKDLTHIYVRKSQNPTTMFATRKCSFIFTLASRCPWTMMLPLTLTNVPFCLLHKQLYLVKMCSSYHKLLVNIFIDGVHLPTNENFLSQVVQKLKHLMPILRQTLASVMQYFIDS